MSHRFRRLQRSVVHAGEQLLDRFGICGSAYLVAFALNHLLAPTFAPIQTPE